VAARLTEAVDGALRNDTDPDSYLRVKEALLAFILTLEASILGVQQAFSDFLCFSRHINTRRRLYMR
jgi:hypothetical protein